MDERRKRNRTSTVAPEPRRAASFNARKGGVSTPHPCQNPKDDRNENGLHSLLHELSDHMCMNLRMIVLKRWVFLASSALDFFVEFALCSPFGGRRRGKGLEVRRSSEMVYLQIRGMGEANIGKVEDERWKLIGSLKCETRNASFLVAEERKACVWEWSWRA